MPNLSIPEPRWKSVFDSLSRIYDGMPSSLEILAGEAGAQYEVENQPFRGVDYDRTGIELHFATRDGSELVHRIAHAKDVQIEETDSGLIAAMQIASDDDPVAVVRFQAPKPSHLLPRATE
jgi:hypothetical protein